MIDNKLKNLNKMGMSIKHMSEILKVSESAIRKRKEKLNLSEHCRTCGKILKKDEKKYCDKCKNIRKKEMKKPKNTKYRFEHEIDSKIKVCIFCGKEFETKDSKKLYCSNECYLDAKSNRGLSNRLKNKNTIRLENTLAFSSLDENNEFVLEPLTLSDISSHGDLFSTTTGKNQIGNSNLGECPKKDFYEEKKIIKKEIKRLLKK